jgi:hypothetical protein
MYNKPFSGSSWVKVLQRKKPPQVLTGVPLMHSLVDPNHKEFLALPPNLVYHTLLHIIFQHQNPMLRSPGCMQDAWAPPLAWYGVGSDHISHTNTGTHAAGCHWIYPDICTWPFYRAVECVAVTAGNDFVTRFKPEAWVPHCQRTVNNSLLLSACDNFFWQGEI